MARNWRKKWTGILLLGAGIAGLLPCRAAADDFYIVVGQVQKTQPGIVDGKITSITVTAARLSHGFFDSEASAIVLYTEANEKAFPRKRGYVQTVDAVIQIAREDMESVLHPNKNECALE